MSFTKVHKNRKTKQPTFNYELISEPAYKTYLTITTKDSRVYQDCINIKLCKTDSTKWMRKKEHKQDSQDCYKLSQREQKGPKVV